MTTLRWARTPPPVAGWYWRRERWERHTLPRPVLCFVGDPGRDDEASEWAGPIDLPLEPDAPETGP